MITYAVVTPAAAFRRVDIIETRSMAWESSGRGQETKLRPTPVPLPALKHRRSCTESVGSRWLHRRLRECLPQSDKKEKLTLTPPLFILRSFMKLTRSFAAAVAPALSDSRRIPLISTAHTGNRTKGPWNAPVCFHYHLCIGARSFACICSETSNAQGCFRKAPNLI